MDTPSIRVLVIDDDREDFQLTRVRLQSVHTSAYEVTWADQRSKGLQLLRESRHDIALVDYRIGPDSGLELIQAAIAEGIRIPFIVLTGQGGYEVDVQALKAGASDYLPKTDLDTPSLDRSIRHALERRQAENALLQSEEFNRKILQSSPDVTTVLDFDGRVLSLHLGRLSRQTGVSDPPPSNSWWLDHWHPEERGLATESFEAAKQGETQEFHARHLHSNGKTAWFDVVVSPILDSNGEPEKVLSVARDITQIKEAKAELTRINAELEQRVQARTAELESAVHALRQEVEEHKATEDRLSQANENLQTKNQEIQNFYHTLSHELKTPLTSAREFICILIDGLAGAVNETQKEYLGIARDSCDQLRACLNDLLDATRLETGKFRLDTQPGSVTELVRKVATAIQPAAAEKQLALDCQVDPFLPEAAIDEVRVHQVLTNLLNNAIKFTPSGGRIQITASLSPKDSDLIRVSVHDTGPGIPPDQLERIFDRLHQVKSGDAANGQGIGLGLYLCRELILLHGGEIWAESQLGQGSVFHFTLKTHRVERPLEILLVEDDANTREALERALERGGYRVLAAAHGREALTLTENHRPDLVLTDLVMPEMNGPELLKCLRTRWDNLPVIIHTGYPDGSLISQAMDSSPFTLLAKPCRLSQMTETVRKVLKQNDTLILRKGSGDRRPAADHSQNLLEPHQPITQAPS